MREALLEVLRCPRCKADGALSLTVEGVDSREIRRGRLRCGRCGHVAVVREGIVDLRYELPSFVVREAAGLERFVEVMRADGWDRERILRLPDDPLPYWQGQKRALDDLVARMGFVAGQRILDVGSNTCWASAAFARLGLEVVALDIAEVEMQGLGTADWFFEDGSDGVPGGPGVFFERVLSVMFDPPFADGSFDWIFCCEVLHHNHAQNLRRTMRELHRLLRPGGRLLVVNEGLRFPLRLKRDQGAEVAAFEGYEHVFFLHEYVNAARRAGFAVRLPGAREAWRAPVRCSCAPSAGTSAAARRWLARRRRGRPLIRIARVVRWWWRMSVRGDASLNMVGERRR